jgi:hypothetical protein
MKTRVHSPVAATERQRTQSHDAIAPRRRRGGLEGVKPASRLAQKQGAYKRVEIFLGLEAAIALRQLMRDGRSAREVIEALLLDAKRRRREAVASDVVRLP